MPNLANLLREGTKDVHRDAENTPFIRFASFLCVCFIVC